MDWIGFLSVQLQNGSELGNQYGISAGLVDPAYRGAFGVQEYGNGVSATAYALFIAGSADEVFRGYPVADVT